MELNIEKVNGSAKEAAMKNTKRILKAVNLLLAIWQQNPDLRLGQLILNSVKESELYYIEDSDLMDRLIHVYKDGDYGT